MWYFTIWINIQCSKFEPNCLVSMRHNCCKKLNVLKCDMYCKNNAVKHYDFSKFVGCNLVKVICRCKLGRNLVVSYKRWGGGTMLFLRIWSLFLKQAGLWRLVDPGSFLTTKVYWIHEYFTPASHLHLVNPNKFVPWDTMRERKTTDGIVLIRVLDTRHVNRFILNNTGKIRAESAQP